MKKVLYVVLALVVIIAVLGLFAPKDFKVERSIVINKPSEVVFDYIKHLKNQNTWGVWAKKDPNIKQEYRGEDGTVGFVSAWEGNDEVGKGEQEIKNLVEGQRMETELRFMKPFESTNNGYMTTEKQGEGQTKVVWGMQGKSPFPFNVLGLFMSMDKMIGKDFEQGLTNLKSELEK